MNLSLHMKKNAKKKYRYTGTHWGESFPRDTDITGEEIWRFLNKNKSLNAKLDADPWQGRYTISAKRPGYHLTEKGFYFQRPGEIHHIKLQGGESRRIEITLQQTYPLTKDQIIELGKVTANAYFAIYDEGAYLPQVYFDLSTGKFGWKPSTDLTINENGILIARLQQQCFGTYTGPLEYEDWNIYTEELLAEWLIDERYHYVPDAEDKIIGYERNSYTPEEIAVFMEQSAAAMRNWCADDVFPHAYQLNNKWHIPIEEGQKLACFTHWRRFLNRKFEQQLFGSPVRPDTYDP